MRRVINTLALLSPITSNWTNEILDFKCSATLQQFNKVAKYCDEGVTLLPARIMDDPYSWHTWHNPYIVCAYTKD